MMTTIDRADMTDGMADGVDRGGAEWLDAGAVDRFCRELTEVRLMVALAALQLAAQWPDCPPAVRPAVCRTCRRTMSNAIVTE